MMRAKRRNQVSEESRQDADGPKPGQGNEGGLAAPGKIQSSLPSLSEKNLPPFALLKVRNLKAYPRFNQSLLMLVAGVLVCLMASAASGQNAADETRKEEAPVSFYKDIRPILQRNCQACHQPNVKSGDLLLTTYEAFLAGGSKGKVVAPGHPEQSLVIAHLTGAAKPQMPFNNPPLPSDQIELFRRWIAQGAEDDTPAEVKEGPKPGKPAVYHMAPVITALAYSPDAKLLAVSGYREILLHHADGSGLIARLEGISDRIQSLAFSPDGSILAAVGGTPATFGEVELWDVVQRNLLRSIRLTNDTLFGASFSPDGSKLAFGAADNAIYVIDVKAGKQLLKMNHHDGWVFGTAFSVDGTQIVSVSRDRAAKLTDVNTGGFIENINQLKGELLSVARHPQKDIVVVGGEDGVPELYMMHRPRSLVIGDTSTLIREFERQDGAVMTVAFSPDGQLIAVGGSSEAVQVYNADTGERVASFGGNQGGTFSVAFSPSGEQLAAAGFNGTVRIYDLKSKQLAKAFVPVPVEENKAISMK